MKNSRIDDIEKAEEKLKANAEKLKQATDLKVKSAEEMVSAVNDKMSNYASGDPKLGKLANHFKIEARLAANEKLFKAADGEEAKQLQLIF